MKVFVSSYAAAKPGLPWDRDAEAALFDGLAKMDLAGLELPFYGRLHAHDDGWLLERFRPEWRFIITLLPGTMDRLKKDPDFGLASPDADGRRRAVDFSEGARRMVQHLQGYLGTKAVAAVCVHSAPRRKTTTTKSSANAFTQSLTDLRSRDWSGAELLIEHCDAFTKTHEPDKGFLGVEDELSAVQASQGSTPLRFMINWGRSAIETRSLEGPVDHVRLVKKSGLLGGLVFSGATPDDTNYGVWKDAHAPFDSTCPKSILTVAAAKKALKAAGTVDFLGLKVQPLPTSLETVERLNIIRASLDAVKRAAE